MKKIILLISCVSILSAWVVKYNGETKLKLNSSANELLLGGGGAGFKVESGVLQYRHNTGSWTNMGGANGNGTVWDQNATNDIKYDQGDVVIDLSSVDPSYIFQIKGLRQYNDNNSAIANGLPIDTVYKTSTGELRIVVAP